MAKKTVISRALLIVPEGIEIKFVYKISIRYFSFNRTRRNWNIDTPAEQTQEYKLLIVPEGIEIFL